MAVLSNLRAARELAVESSLAPGYREIKLEEYFFDCRAEQPANRSEANHCAMRIMTDPLVHSYAW
jgi:hypothetical protein